MNDTAAKKNLDGCVSKRANLRQRAWLTEYYGLTGYEPMGQDDFDARRISFDDLVRRNLRWFDNLNIEVQQMHSWKWRSR